MTKFLFVSGCPRSGTTVLAHILNWSSECLIGMERFDALFENNSDFFTPELFGNERFLRFDSGDCGYPSFSENKELSAWYANIKQFKDLDVYRYRGDKLTTLWRNFSVFDNDDWGRESVTLFHIVRNVYDVASSYQTRLENPDDGWSADFMAGVQDWSNATVAVHEAFLNSDRKFALHIISYDELFKGGVEDFIEAVRLIYQKIGLSLTPSCIDGLLKIHQAGLQRKDMRIVRAHLRKEIDEGVSREIFDMYENLQKASILVEN